MDKEALNDWTIPELKAELERRQLSTQHRLKQDLVERLFAALEVEEKDEDFQDPTEDDDVTNPTRRGDRSAGNGSGQREIVPSQTSRGHSSRQDSLLLQSNNITGDNDLLRRDQRIPSIINPVRTNVQIKKVPLPEFSGLRKDWPEFRSVWKELAENAGLGEVALAFELKRNVRGAAKERIQNIYASRPEAYTMIWNRLEEYYDDPSAAVQSALGELNKLKVVHEGDHKALVRFVDTVEGVHAQLEEIELVDSVSLREVDSMHALLPPSVQRLWLHTYMRLDKPKKIRPFNDFLEFLRIERSASLRISENTSHARVRVNHADRVRPQSTVGDEQQPRGDKCALPGHDGHTTAECSEFKNLDVDARYEALKRVQACFRCFLYHRRRDCPSEGPCPACNRGMHHELLCRNVRNTTSMNISVERRENGILPIQSVVMGGGRFMNILYDGGSSSSYVTYRAASRFGARVLGKYQLDVIKVGNVKSTMNTTLFAIPIKTATGQIVEIKAFGMDKISGPLSEEPEINVLKSIFPGFNVELLQRRGKFVDLLLGTDYYGLHPKNEIRGVGDLSIMKGSLGYSLVGKHARLQSSARRDTFMINRVQALRLEDFICGEELGTQVDVKCGGCRCNKCPVVGSTYSFKEEQEIQIIRENLKYDSDKSAWVTDYPWIKDPYLLPDNYSNALGSLKSLERKLGKNPAMADIYSAQIEDMVEREVARKLSDEEIRNYEGPKYYLSHLAVTNEKSHSTPTRIVFNSSQICQGVSLNSFLAKGPDAYLNNILGLYLKWRSHKYAVVGDIRKMFNSVYINYKEQHCHRFLWRNLNTATQPDIYVIMRVNMGDRPAPAISTEALYKTADMFNDGNEEAVFFIKECSYVDDLTYSHNNKTDLELLVNRVEGILGKGGFRIKAWIFSGEILPEGENTNVRVLGTMWNPRQDFMTYDIPDSLFYSVSNGKKLTANSKMTRRMVLERTMKIWDPLGLLSPFTLLGKIYLRETWENKLGWDEDMSFGLKLKWVRFFENMCELKKLEYGRSLTPLDATGDPTLILVSDGSNIGYGCAAYILWNTRDGKVWCRLIMAKGKIAPLAKKLGTPQMELNGAVLSKRVREIIVKETRFNFDKIIHLVDSETVLKMLNKVSTRFKLYEGVRIGDIQAATNGDMTSWYWIPGKTNIADWLTRGKEPNQIGPLSEWFKGPEIFYRPMEEWGLKPGCNVQLVPVETHTSVAKVRRAQTFVYERFGSFGKILGAIARVFNILRYKSFKGGGDKYLSGDLIVEARNWVVKDVQSEMSGEIELGAKGPFRRLRLDEIDGIWVVGSRMSRYNPLSGDENLPILLPNKHYVTKLVMQDAHVRTGHRGRDATLARFREKFWIVQGGKLAAAIVNNCRKCKLRDPKCMRQSMGDLPEARLRPESVFNRVMLDLFGPYKIRGEVQKRTTGKGYVVIFTDLCMRAVHMEVVYGYDTDSFLLALKRFANTRGWPRTIFSDPGSQLVGAEKELKNMWTTLDKGKLTYEGCSRGLTWVFGPADSPWHQGAVESLVKSAKRAIHFAIQNQRLTATEFQTVVTEISNLLNERPIGVIRGDEDVPQVLTPNSLLLGRNTAENPGPTGIPGSLAKRFAQVELITEKFWSRWIQKYAPMMVVQKKWLPSCRNLMPGDVVLVYDDSVVKGKYRMAMVSETFPGNDGRVRKVKVKYKNFKINERVFEYKGAADCEIIRSVHKLVLLVANNDLI